MTTATDSAATANFTGTSVPVAANANLRRGVSTKGVPNVIAVLPAGNYPALEQCGGEEIVIGNARNFWWVKILAAGTSGWVSAVEVLEGDNDQAIANVPPVPTVNY
jgi:hypothetical protein